MLILFHSTSVYVRNLPIINLRGEGIGQPDFFTALTPSCSLVGFILFATLALTVITVLKDEKVPVAFKKARLLDLYRSITF